MSERVTGVALIATERQRQRQVEGWTPEHDAKHRDQSLAWAAVAYAAPDTVYRREDYAGAIKFRDPWPWQPDKRITTGPLADRKRDEGIVTANWIADRIRELVKAGALIAAEIDRLQSVVSEVEMIPSLIGLPGVPSE